jgi:hypothetical protein
MQMFGWYYFFQIITVLLCIFVKGENNIVDFEYINKTVKVKIFIIFIKFHFLKNYYHY